MVLQRLRSTGVSLIEFILVLVAIAFITLSGVHFISLQVEQNKVRKAADQMQGWLLAAQAYYRDKIQDASFTPSKPGDYWPTNMADMYPYIAASAIALSDTNTKDPWGSSYIVQPDDVHYPYPYYPAYPEGVPKPDPTTYLFFTLQIPIKGLERALAVAAQLPAAQLAKDYNTWKLIKTGDDIYYLNAMIPPPPLVKSAVHHQMVQNLGVVVTKQNGSPNGYNYTLDGLNPDGTIKAEKGGSPLQAAEVQNYGAVFIKAPACPAGTQAYLQASVAGFGIMGGYTMQYNYGHTPAIFAGKGTNWNHFGNVPYLLLSSSPVDPAYYMETLPPNPAPISINTFFRSFQMDMSQYGVNASAPFSTGNSLTSQYKFLGSVIGARVKASALQSNISNQSLEGWYLWLDVTANMAMYPNYNTANLPQVIKDCAMNVNTRDGNGFPYGNSNYIPGNSYDNGWHWAYDYIPSSPNIDSTTGKCTSGNCKMYPSDFILRGTAPFYAPSPCHFHSGYIAYITSCVPDSLAQRNGLDKAMATLRS